MGAEHKSTTDDFPLYHNGMEDVRCCNGESGEQRWKVKEMMWLAKKKNTLIIIKWIKSPTNQSSNRFVMTIKASF